MVNGTGVKATADEIAEAIRRSREVRATPVARVHGRWLHEDAQVAFATWLDALAQAHGLPAPGIVDGDVSHYGMTNEGEFTTYEPELP